MKRSLLAAIAVVLVLVGVPTVALALSSHGSQGARPAASGSPSPSAHGWPHRGFHPRMRGFARRHGMPPGKPFSHHKLTRAQRDRLADRLDAGAKRMQQAADCLRADSDRKALRSCLAKTFPRHLGRFHHWGPRGGGPSGKPSGGVSPPQQQG